MSNLAIFENERAANYDSFVQTWIPNYQFFIHLIPKLLSDVTDKRLLVVGSGTGNEIEAIKKVSPNWTITGVDPSPQMVSIAEEKLKSESGVTLINGEVADLDKTMFGAATLLLVLHFIKDDGAKEKLLSDISEKLQPEAPLIILDITGDRIQIEENLKILKHMLPEGIDEEQINTRTKRIQEDLEHVSESRIEEVLENSGFEKPTRFFQSSIYVGWITRRSK